MENMARHNSSTDYADESAISEVMLMKKPPEHRTATLHVVWNLRPPRSDFDLEYKFIHLIRGKYLRKTIAQTGGVKYSDIKLTQLRGWRLTDREALTNIPDQVPDKSKPKEVYRFVDEKGNLVRNEFVDRERWMEIYDETPVKLAPKPWPTQIMAVSTNARQILDLILVQLSSSEG